MAVEVYQLAEDTVPLLVELEAISYGNDKKDISSLLDEAFRI